MTEQDGKIMEFTTEELAMLLNAMEKKVWTLNHFGMADDNPIKINYKTLRTRVKDELAKRVDES